MILLIDNYDSFTWNIYQFLGDLGVVAEVHRNDKITLEQIEAKQPQAIILSPGPCTPNEAGICLELVEKYSGTIPLLGICLGHEAIGQAFGGKVVLAPAPVHGKLSKIKHTGGALFAECAQHFEATRYHSLVVDEASLPAQLEATAWSDDGLLMALAHKEHLTFGIQFHPESIATEYGHQVLKNFLIKAQARGERQ